MTSTKCSLFKAGKNKLKWTKLLFCLWKPVACRIFHTTALYLFQICFSSYLIRLFYQILFLKITKLAAKETQALQKPGGTPWLSFSLDVRKKLKAFKTQQQARLGCSACVRVPEAAARVLGPPVCSTAFQCRSSWESRGGLQTCWRLPWLKEDLSFRRTEIPCSLLPLASRQTRNGRGGETQGYHGVAVNQHSSGPLPVLCRHQGSPVPSWTQAVLCSSMASPAAQWIKPPWYRSRLHHQHSQSFPHAPREVTGISFNSSL